MFQIDITPYEAGVHELTEQPTAEELELDPDLFKDVEVALRLDVAETRVVVLFDVTATATLECDRTLRLFDQEVGGRYSVLFATPEAAPQYEGGDGEDVFVMDPADRRLDLTAPVRDTLLLSLPVRKVAPGAEEADLPTAFGEREAAIDPRWEALRSLREDDGDAQTS